MVVELAINPPLAKLSPRGELKTAAGTLFPSGNAYAGPFAGFRLDLELVHEPLGAAESQANSAAGGKTIAQCLFEVGNARAFVDEVDPKSGPVSHLHA